MDRENSVEYCYPQFELFFQKSDRDFTLKTLRLKPDKWTKLWASDEQRNVLIKFVDTGPVKII